MKIEERIDAIMEEAKERPLSQLLPQTLVILLECQDFEGYCLLSFWMKPKNKQDKDNMFGFEMIKVMMDNGLSQEEAKEAYKAALVKYTNETKINDESCYGSSVVEMEDIIRSYDKMNEEITEEEKRLTSIPDINECEKTRAKILSLRQNIVFFYSVFRNDMMTHLVKCRNQQKNKSTDTLNGKKTKDISSNVFVIHGHDYLALTEVENFVRQIGLNPIVLFKETSNGKTIIEKLERYAEAGFAIAIYTEFDKGKAKERRNYQYRARQNVVFEHGLLYGILGREHVVALVKGNIEIPSDLSGVVFISMDENGAWRYQIAKEMKAAGLGINLDLI